MSDHEKLIEEMIKVLLDEDSAPVDWAQRVLDDGTGVLEFFDNTFTPAMAAWFEKAYTYINWNVRRQLSDTGKALHRFLSGQPKHYEIHVKKLMTALGYPREYRRFTTDLRVACQQLKDCGWLTDWTIEGNGRKRPHKLMVARQD